MMNRQTLRDGFKGARIALFSVLIAGCASAPPPSPPSSVKDQSAVDEKIKVSHVLDMRVPPSRETLKQKIYVEFIKSPKATQILRDELRLRGFDAVADAKDADAKYYLNGVLIISGLEGQRISKELASMLESSIEINEKDMPAAETKTVRVYESKTVGVGTIALAGAITGFSSSLSITNMAVGVKEWLNSEIPRYRPDYCAQTSCNTYTTGAVVYVEDENSSGQWVIKAFANSKKIIAHLVISEVMENVLQPIYDFKPKIKRMPDTEKAVSPEGNGQ
ncbi:MAG: hypothetical protein LBU76_05360 [Azoarcus sp.]|jgi:hypothetical protein|nr:hypothetical protein [Azoarcus sp.]